MSKHRNPNDTPINDFMRQFLTNIMNIMLNFIGHIGPFSC